MSSSFGEDSAADCKRQCECKDNKRLQYSVQTGIVQDGNGDKKKRSGHDSHKSGDEGVKSLGGKKVYYLIARFKALFFRAEEKLGGEMVRPKHPLSQGVEYTVPS